jgi:hypothetical protein
VQLLASATLHCSDVIADIVPSQEGGTMSEYGEPSGMHGVPMHEWHTGMLGIMRTVCIHASHCIHAVNALCDLHPDLRNY